MFHQEDWHRLHTFTSRFLQILLAPLFVSSYPLPPTTCGNHSLPLCLTVGAAANRLSVISLETKTHTHTHFSSNCIFLNNNKKIIISFYKFFSKLSNDIKLLFTWNPLKSSPSLFLSSSLALKSPWGHKPAQFLKVSFWAPELNPHVHIAYITD